MQTSLLSRNSLVSPLHQTHSLCLYVCFHYRVCRSRVKNTIKQLIGGHSVYSYMRCWSVSHHSVAAMRMNYSGLSAMKFHGSHIFYQRMLSDYCNRYVWIYVWLKFAFINFNFVAASGERCEYTTRLSGSSRGRYILSSLLQWY